MSDSERDENSTSTDTSEEIQYATLMETNGEECESWLYFIKHNDNEKELKYLQKQLEQIEMYVIDDLSTFDLDLEHLVCATTAKEMTKLELNSVAFHRKFDGKLKFINLGLKTKDSNEKRISRAHKKLGFGCIEEFTSDEDIDSEDMDSEKNSSESDHEGDMDLVPVPLGGTVAMEVQQMKDTVHQMSNLSTNPKKKRHRR